MKSTLTIILFIYINPLWAKPTVYPIKKIDSLYKSGNYVMALKLNAEYLTQEELDNACGNVPLALYKAAEISEMLKNRNEAYSFLHRALRRARDCNNDSVTWLAIRHLGGIFQGYETRDSSLYYLNLAYALIKDKDRPAEISSTTGMIGEIWNHLYDKPQQAIPFYKISLAHAERSNNYKSIGYAYLRYGSFLAHHNNCEEGIPLVEKSVKLFLQNKDAEGLYWTRYSLSKVYKVCNRLLEAYDILDLHRNTQDSTFNAEAARQKVQYQLLYETSKKEKENLALTNQIEIETSLRRNMIWFFIIGVALIIIIFMLVYKQYQVQKKIELQNQLISERERLSRELHDNIGSQLSQLATTLDYATNYKQVHIDSEGTLLQTINKTTREIINDLRVTIWAINKPAITFPEFADKLKLTIHRYQQLNVNIKINYTEIIDHTLLNSEEALNLLRICQEAATNAIQHSKCTCINIMLKAHAGQYEIRIKDNGTGFDTAQRKEGHYGIENMNFRAKEMGNQLTITSEAGKGTVISIIKQ